MLPNPNDNPNLDPKYPPSTPVENRAWNEEVDSGISGGELDDLFKRLDKTPEKDKDKS